MNWGFFEALRHHRHSSGHRAVGLALAIRAKAEDPVCNPSITVLCQDASVCRLTVVRAIEQFENQGLIKVERRFGTANKYRLTSSSTRRVPVHSRDGYQSTGETGGSNGTSLKSKPDPSTVETQKRLSKQGHKGQDADLPDWLPEEQWLAFLEHRHALKSPMTPHAQKLAITNLGKLKAEGHPPDQVLEQSIINGWKGLFHLKTQGRAKANHVKVEREDPNDARRANEQAVKEAEKLWQS